MIHWKYIFWSVLGIAFIADVFEEGLMSIGIILGWLVGMMTVTQWEMEARKKRRTSKQTRSKAE